MSSLDKKKRKNSKVDSGKITSSKSVENEKPSTEESNINTDNLSRKAKRRRQVANLKLSQSRLKAYGKIPSKSKHGGKHWKLSMIYAGNYFSVRLIWGSNINILSIAIVKKWLV